LLVVQKVWRWTIHQNCDVIDADREQKHGEGCQNGRNPAMPALAFGAAPQATEIGQRDVEGQQLG
jgi:hypothetical protein